MAFYLVTAFVLVLALSAAITVPDEASKRSRQFLETIKRLYGWIVPTKQAGQHDFRPSFPVRVALVAGAYVGVASMIMIVAAVATPNDSKIATDADVLENVIVLPVLLFGLFPYGLGNFFGLAPSFVPHLVYLVWVAICFIVRQLRTFVMCFAAFGVLLFLNVAGCAKGISL